MSAAQSPRLRQLSVTPDSGPPGRLVTVQLVFDRPGQAMPILTSSNPRVLAVGGNWRTNGAPSITRNLRLGRASGCTTVTANWGGASIQ